MRIRIFGPGASGGFSGVRLARSTTKGGMEARRVSAIDRPSAWLNGTGPIFDTAYLFSKKTVRDSPGGCAISINSIIPISIMPA